MHIASTQHNLISKSIEIGEDINEVEGIDQDICSNDILEMYKVIPEKESHTDIDNASMVTETITNQSMDICIIPPGNEQVSQIVTCPSQQDGFNEIVQKFLDAKLSSGKMTPFSIIKILRKMGTKTHLVELFYPNVW